jgi:hypothetical protein
MNFLKKLVRSFCLLLSFFIVLDKAYCSTQSKPFNYFSEENQIVPQSTAIFAQDSIVPAEKATVKVRKEGQYDRDALVGFILVVGGSLILPVITWFFGIKRCVKALSSLRTSKKKGRKLAIAGIIIGVIYLTGYAMLISAVLI